jgi:hypothetical protein
MKIKKLLIITSIFFLVIILNDDFFKSVVKSMIYKVYPGIQEVTMSYKIRYENLARQITSSFNNLDYVDSDTIYLNDKAIYSYKFPSIFPGKHDGSVSSGYIDFIKKDQTKNQLLYVSGSGVFLEINKLENRIYFKTLNSNITDIVKYDEFYLPSDKGIKDILIDKDDIYISINMLFKDSINNIIYHSKLDTLNFTKFFVPNDFIKIKRSKEGLSESIYTDYGEFNSHQSGGRLVKGRNDSIIVTFGEYRVRDLAQDPKSINGKIVSISKKDKKYRVLSTGHRNPQGLYYSKNHDFILSSEHGPSGGDEINFQNNLDSLYNFGWPISSYGLHYDDQLIDGAPLYKSHKDYGFQEPIFYFSKSPGVSEIVVINTDKENIDFIVSTMGWPDISDEERKYLRSILFFRFNYKSNEIKLINNFSLNERIRDMKYIDESDELYLFGETTGTLFHIKNLTEFLK